MDRINTNVTNDNRPNIPIQRIKSEWSDAVNTNDLNDCPMFVSRCSSSIQYGDVRSSCILTPHNGRVNADEEFEIKSTRNGSNEIGPNTLENCDESNDTSAIESVELQKYWHTIEHLTKATLNSIMQNRMQKNLPPFNDTFTFDMLRSTIGRYDE